MFQLVSLHLQAFHWIELAITVLLFLMVLYVVVNYLLIESFKRKYKTKKPFFICEKGHGFPEEHALTLPLNEVGITDEPVKMCPICYANDLRNANKFKEGSD